MAIKNVTQDAPLRPWAYVVLAVIVAIIGLASSAVTADFFILGLKRMESDVIAREALIAAGILMIVTELAAFGIAALLPRATLRSLRVHLMMCGVLLLAFEATTIYVTQVTLAQTSDTVASSSVARAGDLRTSIANQRAAAQALRDNGTVQSQSNNAWSRHLGAVALRDAIQVEQNISTLSAELATLESTGRPTLTSVLGAKGVLAYAVARAMLISLMGLVMFGAAGALLRAARETAYARRTETDSSRGSAGIRTEPDIFHPKLLFQLNKSA